MFAVLSVVEELATPSGNDLFDARAQIAITQGDRHVVALLQASAASQHLASRPARQTVAAIQHLKRRQRIELTCERV